MENWKFAVKSLDDLRKRGLCAWYSILINGKNMFDAEKTEEWYAENGYAVLNEAEFDTIVREHEESLLNHWTEETAEQYDNALNILPPSALGKRRLLYL